MEYQRNEFKTKCQPLLKAKYCPRVAKCWISDKHHIFEPSVCDLCLRVCIFNRLLQGIKIQGSCLCNISSIQANWFKRYHARKNTKPTWRWLLNYDLDIQQAFRGCQGCVHAKFQQAKCSGSFVIVLTVKKTYRRCWKQYCRRSHGQ